MQALQYFFELKPGFAVLLVIRPFGLEHMAFSHQAPVLALQRNLAEQVLGFIRGYKRCLIKVAVHTVDRLDQAPQNACFPLVASSRATGLLGPFTTVIHLRKWRGNTWDIDFEKVPEIMAWNDHFLVQFIRQYARHASARIAVVQAGDVRMILPSFSLHIIVLGTIEEESKE
ncbi:hypothetical protein ASC94_19570 [Massilia sp. Root418]|nr:hypothetical protein ASC94_19570 [Massilia sp. Root418]